MNGAKLFLVFVCLCFGQDASQHSANSSTPPFSLGDDIHLTHKQHAALIKQDHDKSARDAAALLELARELQSEIEVHDDGAVSAKALKDSDEIERLARSIHGRLMRN